MNKNNFIGLHHLINYLLAVSAFFLASCGDDVTNNYYAPKDETPQEEHPTYSKSEWVKEVSSPCFFGFFLEEPVLFPMWLLQAEGVKNYYKDNSRFAQQYITEDLLMILRNPGPGTNITLQTEESDICYASEYSYTVEEDMTDEMLTLQIPVNWNYNVLRTWRTDNMVKLAWTVLLDGQEADQYTRNFNCRSVNCYTTSLFLDKSSPENVEMIKEAEFGTFPVTENEDQIAVWTTDFIMGYIDENSPLIERLKSEVLSDGYLSLFTGLFSPTDEELLSNAVDAFTYLMMKYRITYAARHASDIQYLRTIDDIFTSRQGYCMELAIAFASWCMNLGIKCTLESVPGHMCNQVIGNEGILYPADMTLLASEMHNIPPFSVPPSESNFAEAKNAYQVVLEASYWNNVNDYQPGREAGEISYQTTYPDKRRLSLPSFNIGQNYVNTRTIASQKQIRAVTNPLWKKHGRHAVE